MVVRKGDISISIEQIEGFGKNPGLWVGTGNQLTKVASFGSEQKAEMFCDWIKYMLSDGGDGEKDGRFD